MSKRKRQCMRPPCVRQRAAAQIAAELQGRIDALEYALRVVVERAVSAERRAIRAEYAVALSEKRVGALETSLAKPSVSEMLRKIADGAIAELLREADADDERSDALLAEALLGLGRARVHEREDAALVDGKTEASEEDVHEAIELESRADGIRHALRSLGLLEARS